MKKVWIFIIWIIFKMSRKYDSKTTTFTPEGRLQQIEYAMEAINKTGSSIGIIFFYSLRYRNQRRSRLGHIKTRSNFLIVRKQSVIKNIPNRQAYFLRRLRSFSWCQLLDQPLKIICSGTLFLLFRTTNSSTDQMFQSNKSSFTFATSSNTIPKSVVQDHSVPPSCSPDMTRTTSSNFTQPIHQVTTLAGKPPP